MSKDDAGCLLLLLCLCPGLGQLLVILWLLERALGGEE